MLHKISCVRKFTSLFVLSLNNTVSVRMLAYSIAVCKRRPLLGLKKWKHMDEYDFGTIMRVLHNLTGSRNTACVYEIMV